MDADQLTCKGIQFKGALKTSWSRFRDQHLVQYEGSYDQVVDKAHERYRDEKNGLLKGGVQQHQQSAPEAIAPRCA